LKAIPAGGFLALLDAPLLTSLLLAHPLAVAAQAAWRLGGLAEAGNPCLDTTHRGLSGALSHS